jgi:hypothetical protein
MSPAIALAGCQVLTFAVIDLKQFKAIRSSEFRKKAVKWLESNLKIRLAFSG